MANLEQLKGLVHSQRVLLGLTQRGMSREDAYQAVHGMRWMFGREIRLS